MDLETLQHANFAKFSESVDDWKLLLKNLKGLQTDAEDGLEKAAQKADWEGLNSQVTKKFVTKTAAEFTDAHTEAQTIYNILNDTLGELKGFHRELNTAIERGRGKSLTVIAYDGGFTVTSNVPPEARAAMDKENADEITALRDDLQRIVNRATESDKGAARALDLVINQAQHGFSDVTAKDRDSAVEAIDEARKIEKIMKKDPDDITNTELARLNASMAKYKDNPFYADTLASEVGAKRTLDFYTAVNDDSQFRVHPRSGKGLSEEQKERKKLLRGLEKNLGTTLGTASHSDSPGMRAWKSDMTAIGSTYEPPVDGYRAMSNLMRNGHYETDFLLDYGDSMITYEKENKQDHYGGLQRDKTADDVLPWDENDGHARTRYGVDNDAGKDPMTGFMEALGHNSEASTAFFKDDKQFDYLTEGRKWPEDHSSQDTKGGTAGYNSLGHALESATKGAPYDADPPRLQRDADTAAVAEKVVERYGQDPEYNKDHKQTGLSGAQLMDKQAGIGDSIGSIGAAYIDDINWSMDGNADKSLYAIDDGGRSSHGERAHFDPNTAAKFLSAVGQDPQGYAQVSTAQQAYTTSLVDAHMPTPPQPGAEVDTTEAATALRTGGTVHGILDHARAEEVKAEGRAADQKYNDAIDERTERNKLIASVAVGGTVGIVPSPATGVAATVIPVVADGTESIAGGLIEQNIDRYGKSQHRDNSEEWHDDGRHVYEKGRNAAWAPGQSALEGANGSEKWDDEAYRDLSNDLLTAYQTGYNHGSGTDGQVGMLPTPST